MPASARTASPKGDAPLQGSAQESAADRAYAFVKRQIVSGEYAGGTLISEGEVSAAVEVSRTPVREAFLRLEVEGLLRLYPKRGALVVPVSASEIRDVLEARLVIEQHAARTAIAAGRHRELAAELRAILGLHNAADVSRDLSRFTEIDQQFHGALVSAAGNGLLAGFYATLRDRQLRMSTASILSGPGRRDTILAEHAAVADRIAEGDAEAAAEALAVHLAATRASLSAS